MKTKRTFTHISQEEFKNIKMLQSAGLSANKVSRVTKRTHRVVSNIFRTETLAEYKELSAETKVKQKQLELPTEDALKQMNPEEVVKFMMNIAEILTDVQEKVDFISRHTEVKPVKSFMVERS